MIVHTVSCYHLDMISSRGLENPPEPLLVIHSFEQIHWGNSQWQAMHEKAQWFLALWELFLSALTRTDCSHH